MILAVCLIVIGVVFGIYDAALIIANPGTFLDNLTSFSHVWLAIGGYLVFEGIHKIKKGNFFCGSWKKWFKRTLVSLLGIGCLIAAVNLCYIFTPDVVGLDEDSDYVILLGGGIDKNGKLPTTVKSRVNKTAEYLNLHPDTICVVTGGTLKWLPYPEAPAIKAALVEAGIAEERILIEQYALDTIENFILSCNVLSEFTGKTKQEILDSSIVVTTNSFHLARAQVLARRLGFTNVKGISAKTPAFHLPHALLREIGAYEKLNFRILLTGKPEKADIFETLEVPAKVDRK